MNWSVPSRWPIASAARWGRNFIACTAMPASLVTRTRGFGLRMSFAIAAAMSSGWASFRPFVPPIPEVSSVLVKVGRTEEITTPVPADSSLAASVKPSTPYLVAQ